MSSSKRTTIALSATAWGVLALAGAVSFSLPTSLGMRSSCAAPMFVPPSEVTLNGMIRDFKSDHPDFNIFNGADMGHYAANVAPGIGATGRPTFTSAGQEVMTEWYDKDANPIMPDGGPGLPFGHFDVDVYDQPTTSELYHEHQFDDKFDVTYIDIAGDAKLLFDSVIGAGYPNDLRIEFFNEFNSGGGTYIFQADGPVQAGTTADGFTTTFTPSQLTQLRVDFVALDYLRGTEPKVSQGDIINRDDAFAVRMYDVSTDALVYEIAVYHHIQKKKKKKKDKKDKNKNPPPSTDSCGVQIADIPGTFGAYGLGATTSSDTFDQWYRDDIGTNLSKGHGVMLTLNDAGVYEYLTDSFYPIDGQLYGNESADHNNYFTYTIEATFTYNACTSQFFEFEGNDDAWVFIDDKLVIDLGGVNTPERQYAALDRMNLVDGQVYSLKFYYAHRRETLDSVFRMRTNLELTGEEPPTASPVFD